MEKGLNIQIPLMANRFRKGEIRVETLTRSGEWFRENFPVTPPDGRHGTDRLPRKGS